MIPPAADDACLYDCNVVHRRHIAPLARFAYRLSYMLVDIDRLEALHRRFRWFSLNRFNLVSLHDADHGSRKPGQLRAWAENILSGGGVELEGGRIRLLCLPRILGFAFNPLSLWYCEDADGRLRAVIAEVRNTFGERHSYLLTPAGDAITWDEAIVKDKVFHVSPFLDLAARYRFRVEPPGNGVRMSIGEQRDGAKVLDACLAGRRSALTDRSLLVTVARTPWAALRVVFGIHWQALLLWLRGARYHPKPQPPITEAS